jgi:hypothetical protein
MRMMTPNVAGKGMTKKISAALAPELAETQEILGLYEV